MAVRPVWRLPRRHHPTRLTNPTRRRTVIPDTTTQPADVLWSVYLEGGDEYHAAASRDDAEQMAANFAAYDRKCAREFGSGTTYLQPRVARWPFDAAAHAKELAEG